jgi:hypothetical protein
MVLRPILYLFLVSLLVSGPDQSPRAGLIHDAARAHSEEIEWTWEVRPSHVDPRLPNVLLVGDSITRNYYPDVVQKLTGSANVYLFATSTSLGDPRLPKQLAEFWLLEGVQFRVIHLNNGLHGWSYTEDQYRDALPSFLAEVRRLDPEGHLIWTTITPVKEDVEAGATNVRIDLRNKIASAFFRKQGIPEDDQHRLMLPHRDDYQDSVHFNEAGSAIQAEQVARIIQSSLAGK